MSTDLAIQLRELTRRYGRVVAVDHLTLEVPRGALYGLIGPNGAGKTTTMRMLATLLNPTWGEAYVCGYSIYTKPREIRRLIGYMPDFFGVYHDMLVWEYLDFFARCYRLPAAKRKTLIDELLELVNLTDKRDANVQALSRGMQQRLCLAHALIHNPQVLLLDEPASGLDPRARVEMRELLKELAAMGKTIIVSSHILAELAEMCTQVGIVEKGKLVASGSLDVIRGQMHANRVLRVRVLADEAEARELLRADGMLSVGELVVVPSNGRPGTTLGVQLKGDDRAAAQLLAQWVARGAPIVEFSEAGNELEELFLRLTAPESA
jgi:ABC-2 type transport system ATP-binding protein